jgi:hypothetical protein
MVWLRLISYGMNMLREDIGVSVSPQQLPHIYVVAHGFVAPWLSNGCTPDELEARRRLAQPL